MLVARITVATTVQISPLIISMRLAGIEKIAVMSGTQTHAVHRNVKVNTSEARPFCLPCFPSRQTKAPNWSKSKHCESANGF